MDFRNPVPTRIVRDADSRRLYRLEERRNEVIKQCAVEWIKVASDQSIYLERLIAEAADDNERLYKIALPQQLMDILDAFDLKAACLAAEGFLKLNGYTVTESK